MTRFDTTLFVFRRDLRLEDNRGLLQACRQSRRVIPAFIFDRRQIENNPYRSNIALQFMLERLDELDSELQALGGRLHRFRGLPHEIVAKLLSDDNVSAVFFNRDYTPFSHERDRLIEQVCRELGREFVSVGDSLLNEPEDVRKEDGSPYTVFTPYWKRASGRDIPMPESSRPSRFANHQLHTLEFTGSGALLPTTNADIFARGSRADGLRIIGNLSEHSDYLERRDIPNLPGTTGLSAYLKFGILSVREVALAIRQQLGEDHPLMRQLHWREFFTQIAFHFPHVFGGGFHRQYDRLPWRDNPDAFERWCNGTTGFPIVDASMRQLNRTGWMHNRVRMIAASFLVKDLHIDWRLGEKYFATRLIDYDPAVNNGNWQWAASTGCDAAPYFRIFNPWLQQARFDPEANYIRRWVPELASCPTTAIHKPNAVFERQSCGYPAPAVDHAIESQIAKKMFAGLNMHTNIRPTKSGRRVR